MKKAAPLPYDRWLLFSVFGLMGMGLLMVASSSMVISERQFGESFHYLMHQAVYTGIGIVLAFIVLRVETDVWRKMSGMMLVVSLMALVMVLIPGIGKTVNGSTRWLGVGPIGGQVSEFAKLGIVIYMAGYLVRHADEVRTEISGFIKPMIILCVVAFLLLLEPDFGATVVIISTALGMMFLAGVRLRHFIVLMGLAGGAATILAVSSPYRMARLTGFLNPWANAFDSGYQLTQSLIAFGRGGWFGVGLGESIQKLFYLPEAHTDFLLAVLAEELGLMGVTFVLLLFTIFVVRAMGIGRKAYQLQRPFAGYTAYGLGLWIGLQTIINVGVNSGVLPTKGLTLPFMSYGGSSLLITCIVVAILLRIDFENRELERRL